MDIKLDLSNRHFGWEHLSIEDIEIFFKGNVFHKGELLVLCDLGRLFAPYAGEGLDLQGLLALLKQFNGSYAIAVDSPHRVLVVADRIRSIPLFYSEKSDVVCISDDAYRLRGHTGQEVDEPSAVEFLLSGYVGGPETLVKGIRQVRAGEVISFEKDGAKKSAFYYRFRNYRPQNRPESKLLDTLDGIFNRVFFRLKKSTVDQGLRIVIPLSGGLDSRIIAAMLKRQGVTDAICFTYGRRNNLEARISGRVASELGYEWHFVEHSARDWHRCYNSPEMEEFLRYGSNLVSLPSLQDFLAVKVLKEKGILPFNAVFVPGHSGDMLAGSHLPPEEHFNYSKKLADYLIKKHYSLWEISKGSAREALERKIMERIPLEVSDYASYAEAIELYDYEERQAKYIVNSVRTYEFFGYGWRIPLWDSELMDFFKGLPLECRHKQALYIDYAYKRLFLGELERLKAIETTTKGIGGTQSWVRPVKGFDACVSMLFDEYLDVRWGRFCKDPLIGRLLLGRRKKDGGVFEKFPVVSSIINGTKVGLRTPLIGYQTKDYLERLVGEAKPI